METQNDVIHLLGKVTSPGDKQTALAWPLTIEVMKADDQTYLYKQRVQRVQRVPQPYNGSE